MALAVKKEAPVKLSWISRELEMGAVAGVSRRVRKPG